MDSNNLEQPRNERDTSSGRARILVADDDPHMQQAIKACLSRGNYQFSVVGNGLAALELLEQEQFDLVINIPKNTSRRELENDYIIRRSAIDFNIPLLTNARLASAFITAFCNKSMEDIKITSWDEY